MPVAFDQQLPAASAICALVLHVVNVSNVGKVKALIDRCLTGCQQRFVRRSVSVCHSEVGMKRSEMDGHVWSDGVDNPLAHLF